MIWSLLIFTVAIPRSRAKRRIGRFRLPCDGAILVTVCCELEIHGRAGLNPEQVAHFLGDRDLPFEVTVVAIWNKVIQS